MANDIRYAGLDTRFYRQLMQAVNLMYSSYNKVTATVWGGTRCDLVVVDPAASEGAAALREADSLQVPAIVVAQDATNDQHRSVPATVTTAYLTEVVRSLLTGAPTGPNERQSALVRLATEPAWVGQDVDATVRGRSVALRPSAGQAFAYSRSELYEMANQFIDTSWTFEPADTVDFSEVGSLASMRLEAFYLVAADVHRDALPAVPNDDLRLQRWPNLEQAADLEYPLQVAGVLQKGDKTPGAIALETGLSTAQVTACLWAFRAAGVVQPAKAVAEEVDRGGFFSQLFGHFRSDRGGQAVAS